MVALTYIVGTAVVLGLVDLLATKWAEWHEVLEEDD